LTSCVGAFFTVQWIHRDHQKCVRPGEMGAVHWIALDGVGQENWNDGL